MWLESAHGTHIECAVLFAELCEGIVEIHAKSAILITGPSEEDQKRLWLIAR